MRTMLRTARTALFAFALTGALGYGGATALAAPAELRPCPETAIGSCSSLSRCQDLCAQLGGNVSQARCDNGCCFCPIFL